MNRVRFWILNIVMLAPMLAACAAGGVGHAPGPAAQPPAATQPLDFTVDRRPVLMIRMWNGSYGPSNPLGLSPGFRGDDAGKRLAQTLTREYAKGWRRFMLHTPAGGPQGATLSKTLGEWWARPQRWRDTMQRSLRSWLAEHPDASVGIYTGLRLRDGSHPDAETLARCLRPWVDAGLTEFAFDATSPIESRDAFVRAKEWLRERGARAVMEAWPVDRERRIIEPDWLRQTPMLAITRFEGMHDPEQTWRFDPQASEVWIGVGRGGGPTLEEARDYVERGYVLLVYSIDERDRMNALVASQGR